MWLMHHHPQVEQNETNWWMPNPTRPQCQVTTLHLREALPHVWRYLPTPEEQVLIRFLKLCFSGTIIAVNTNDLQLNTWSHVQNPTSKRSAYDMIVWPWGFWADKKGLRLRQMFWTTYPENDTSEMLEKMLNLHWSTPSLTSITTEKTASFSGWVT